MEDMQDRSSVVLINHMSFLVFPSVTSVLSVVNIKHA